MTNRGSGVNLSARSVVRDVLSAMWATQIPYPLRVFIRIVNFVVSLFLAVLVTDELTSLRGVGVIAGLFVLLQIIVGLCYWFVLAHARRAAAAYDAFGKTLLTKVLQPWDDAIKARMSMRFCIGVIVASLSIIVGFFWLRFGEWGFWSSAGVLMALLAFGVALAIGIFIRLWPALNSVPIHFLIFGVFLPFSGWHGATESREQIHTLFKASWEMFPSTFTIGLWLAALIWIALFMAMAAIIYEIVVVLFLVVDWQGKAKKRSQVGPLLVPQKPRTDLTIYVIRLLSGVTSFFVILVCAQVHSWLSNQKHARVLMTQVAWWGDLSEAPDHCRYKEKKNPRGATDDERIALRLPQFDTTIAMRIDKALPDKPVWRFDMHELERFGTADIRSIHCDFSRTRQPSLKEAEVHQEHTRHLWGIAPIGRVKLAPEADPAPTAR